MEETSLEVDLNKLETLILHFDFLTFSMFRLKQVYSFLVEKERNYNLRGYP